MPGHEIVGIVAQVGPEVTGHRVGDRVGVGCMVNSCRECTNSRNGDEQYCLEGMTPTYAGIDSGGTVTQGGYSTSGRTVCGSAPSTATPPVTPTRSSGSLAGSTFGSMEKVGELPEPLSTAGAPPGANPAVGDIGYYAPWNNLVLYYGDQSYHNGIVRLGHLDGDVDVIGREDGDVTISRVRSGGSISDGRPARRRGSRVALP